MNKSPAFHAEEIIASISRTVLYTQHTDRKKKAAFGQERNVIIGYALYSLGSSA